MSLNKLGRYDILRVLGKGAMGLVYEARDPNLDRRVAIKTIKVENLSEQASTEYEARFRTEAHSAARLQHPNIVSVYDSDRHGDIAYLVMAFVQGDDLKRHLDSGTRATAPAAAPGARSTPSRTSQQASAEPPAAPAPVAGQPDQACQSQVLLGFQICMNEQCAKPAFANHPECVERRNAEKLRHDSQSSGRN